MHERILSQTIDLLQDEKGDWPRVAKEAGVGLEWIKRLARGEIAEPGHFKVMKLHGYLLAINPAVESAA